MVDLVIRGGRVVDPASKTSSFANLYIQNGKIAGLGGEDRPARHVLDASGLVVSPGFIDPHTHVDREADENTHRCACLSLAQGVTSIISGNCGGGRMDLDRFFAEMDAGFPLSHAELFGHNALRRHLQIEDIFAPATPSEIKEMERLCEEAMQKGVLGVSFGLGYVPGTSWDEVLALSAIAKRHGRVVAVDTYMDDNYDLENLRQLIGLSRELGVRVQISHFVYQYGQGVIEEALKLMDEARAEGVDIWADSGLYVDWASGISSECFRESYVYSEGFQLSDFLVATGEHTGKRLDDALYRHLRGTKARESVICKTGFESSLLPPFTRGYVMPSSDTAPYAPGQGHPQVAGSFAGFFRLVREKGVMTLEEAVYRATLLPARTFGLPGKGSLEVGADADIAVFDFDSIEDCSRYPDEGAPDAPAKGVR
ncbi:MAG: amidohydrolase family protein, partial [Christensenellaceae bacterium]|nr:amidohydrolase family protein [Christensenellaceae bacterium]